jgi:urease accessory protein
MKRVHQRGLAAVVLAGFAGAAAAHTGHGTESFFEGLAHPFGLDHLLAMVAVGIWSVYALPAGRAWTGPATFMFALLASAAVGVTGVTVPLLEVAIAASVFVFGVMLLLAARRKPEWPGLGLVALAACLHGLAHGAEAPAAAGFVNYAAGFLITTAVLHFGGVFAGLSLRRWFATRAANIVGGLGVACGGAGLYLLSQF